MTDFAIRTENLSRDFPSVRAVDALTMTVRTGVIFGFLGLNGAGKTTTTHLLLGLLQQTSGQAEVLGFDVWTKSDAIRQHTGVLLEHTGLYERLNAEDNLEFYGRSGACLHKNVRHVSKRYFPLLICGSVAMRLLVVGVGV